MIRVWTLVGLALAWAGIAHAEIVSRLPTQERVVALTFDACEAGAKMQFDEKILAILAEKRVPFTIFMGGRFARDNESAVAALARNPQVGIENHSWSHPKDMRALSDAQVGAEITRAADEIARVSGRRTSLFRFPGGNADARTVALAEKLGYRVVHWRWPEGDPDPGVSAKALVNQTLTRTKPGEVLIFHINRRGVHTAEALPAIIDGLQKQGFRFVLVSDYVRP